MNNKTGEKNSRKKKKKKNTVKADTIISGSWLCYVAINSAPQRITKMLKPAQSWHSALIFLEGLRKSLTVSPSGFSSCLDAGSTDIIQHWGQSLSSFKPLNRVSHLRFCLSTGVLHTCSQEVLSQIFVESSFRPFKNKKKSSHFLFVGLWVNGKKQINNSDSTISPPPIVPLTWGIARHSLELQWWEPLGLLSSPSGVRLSDQHNKLRGGGRGRLWIIGLNLVRSGLLWSGAVLGKLQVCG